MKVCDLCTHCRFVNFRTEEAYCELKDKDIPINEAEKCNDFLYHMKLCSCDIDIVKTYTINHVCPYCGNRDFLTRYDSKEGYETIECPNCGEKYVVSWSLRDLEEASV